MDNERKRVHSVGESRSSRQSFPPLNSHKICPNFVRFTLNFRQKDVIFLFQVVSSMSPLSNSSHFKLRIEETRDRKLRRLVIPLFVFLPSSLRQEGDTFRQFRQRPSSHFSPFSRVNSSPLLPSFRLFLCPLIMFKAACDEISYP